MSNTKQGLLAGLGAAFINHQAADGALPVSTGEPVTGDTFKPVGAGETVNAAPDTVAPEGVTTAADAGDATAHTEGAHTETPTSDAPDAPTADTVTADTGTVQAGVRAEPDSAKPAAEKPLTKAEKKALKKLYGVVPTKPAAELRAALAAQQADTGKPDTGKPDSTVKVDAPDSAKADAGEHKAPAITKPAAEADNGDLTNVRGFNLSLWPAPDAVPGLPLPPLNAVWRHKGADGDELNEVIPMVAFIELAQTVGVMSKPDAKQLLAAAIYLRPDMRPGSDTTTPYSMKAVAYVLQCVCGGTIDDKRNIVTKFKTFRYGDIVEGRDQFGRKTWHLRLNVTTLKKAKAMLTGVNPAYQLPGFFAEQLPA